jgi:hypothetical protein
VAEVTGRLVASEMPGIDSPAVLRAMSDIEGDDVARPAPIHTVMDA